MEPRPQKAEQTSSRAGAVLGRWQPPFFYGWIIVAVVFLADFTAGGVGHFNVPLFFKPMSDSLGWSLTQLTIALSAQAIAMMVVSPFIGPLLDRFGARPVMGGGAIVAGIGLILLMGIQEVWQFWVLYAIVGALGLHEMGQLTGPVVVAKWFIRHRGRAMAFATIGVSVGAMVMAPVIGYLIPAIGWRQTWGVMGIMLLIIMLPTIAVFMRRQPEDMGLQPDGNTVKTGLSKSTETPATPQENLQPSTEPTWTLREALSTPTLWILIASLNLVIFMASPITIHTVPYLTLQESMSLRGVSIVLVMRQVGGTFSRIIWGFLVERFSVRICLAVMISIRALGPLCLVLIPYPYNVPPFVLFSGLGAAMSVLQPVAFANYYGRAFIGSIQGSMRPLLGVSQMVGPVIVAAVFDATGTFDIAFLVASALGFTAAAVVLFAKPPVQRAASDRA